MSDPSTLETLLRRDRAFVLAGLVGVTAISWVYMFALAAGMDEMAGSIAQLRPWSALDFLLMFVMWVVMMIAMMIPRAAPMILLFAGVQRRSQRNDRPFVPVAAFVSGYAIVWTGFSLLATLAQWALENAALLSPMLVSTSPLLGGGLLVAAGVYQWTPYKDGCLKHCRTPFQFVMEHWRTGTTGALRMGLEHGAYCLGCCWILMGLLFFGGVMNLLWIATIAAFVLIEKLAPAGAAAGRVVGLALVAAGIFVVARA